MMNNAVDQLIEDYNQAESEADRERLADLLQEVGSRSRAAGGPPAGGGG